MATGTTRTQDGQELLPPLAFMKYCSGVIVLYSATCY